MILRALVALTVAALAAACQPPPTPPNTPPLPPATPCAARDVPCTPSPTLGPAVGRVWLPVCYDYRVQPRTVGGLDAYPSADVPGGPTHEEVIRAYP